MKGLYALEGGFVGATAVTLIHQAVKKIIPTAPRLDLLGMEAISKGIKAIKGKEPNSKRLYVMAMAGDFITNTLFYSIAGVGDKKNAVAKGAGLGLAAGLGAVLLPKPMHLNQAATNRTLQTKLMTVGLYVVGGMVASMVMKFLDRKQKQEHDDWQHRLITSSQA